MYEDVYDCVFIHKDLLSMGVAEVGVAKSTSLSGHANWFKYVHDTRITFHSSFIYGVAKLV